MTREWQLALHGLTVRAVLSGCDELRLTLIDEHEGRAVEWPVTLGAIAHFDALARLVRQIAAEVYESRGVPREPVVLSVIGDRLPRLLARSSRLLK